jgi:hypothetical protein
VEKSCSVSLTDAGTVVYWCGKSVVIVLVSSSFLLKMVKVYEIIAPTKKSYG